MITFILKTFCNKSGSINILKCGLVLIKVFHFFSIGDIKFIIIFVYYNFYRFIKNLNTISFNINNITKLFIILKDIILFDSASIFCDSISSSYSPLLIYYDCLFRSIRLHDHLYSSVLIPLHDVFSVLLFPVFRYQFQRLINTVP